MLSPLPSAADASFPVDFVALSSCQTVPNLGVCSHFSVLVLEAPTPNTEQAPRSAVADFHAQSQFRYGRSCRIALVLLRVCTSGFEVKSVCSTRVLRDSILSLGIRSVCRFITKSISSFVSEISLSFHRVRNLLFPEAQRDTTTTPPRLLERRGGRTDITMFDLFPL